MTPRTVTMTTRNRTNGRPSGRSRGLHPFCFFITAMAFILQEALRWPASSFFTEAYKVGDYVDASLSTRSALTIDLLMANQPLFGVPRTVHLPRLPERFSLSFEEGFHSLPYVEGQTLEQLVVTFVYSKSGDGRIHSVASKAIRLPKNQAFDKKEDIQVVFDWIEEASLDLEAGAAIMFLAVFVASILFLLQLCTMDNGGEHDTRRKGQDHIDQYYKGR